MQLMTGMGVSADVYDVVSRVKQVVKDVRLNEMYWLRNYVYVSATERGGEYRAEVVTAEGLRLQVVIWQGNGRTNGHVEITSVHAGSCNCECNGGGDY